MSNDSSTPFGAYIASMRDESSRSLLKAVANASVELQKELALVVVKWRNTCRLTKSMIAASPHNGSADLVTVSTDMEQCISELEMHIEHKPWATSVANAIFASSKDYDAIINTMFSTIAASSEQTAALDKIARDAKREVIACEQKLARLTAHSIANPDTRDRIWAMTDGHCFYCDVKLVKTRAELTPTCNRLHVFHIDHIVAKEKGGPDHIDNYVPSCMGCNISKSDKSFAEFVKTKQPRLRLVSGGAQAS